MAKKVQAIGKDLYIDGQLTGSASSPDDALKIAQNTASQPGFTLDMFKQPAAIPSAFPAPGGQFFTDVKTQQPSKPLVPTQNAQPGTTASSLLPSQTNLPGVTSPLNAGQNFNYDILAKQFGLSPLPTTPDTTNEMRALEAQRAARQQQIASESIRAAKDVEVSGQQRTGAAKSALARIGALGTTTAAIGALDTIKADTDRLTQEVIRQKEQALQLADQGFYEQASLLNAKAEETARKNYQQNFENLMNIINFTTQLNKNKQQEELLPLQLEEQALKNQKLQQELEQPYASEMDIPKQLLSQGYLPITEEQAKKADPNTVVQDANGNWYGALPDTISKSKATEKKLTEVDAGDRIEFYDPSDLSKPVKTIKKGKSPGTTSSESSSTFERDTQNIQADMAAIKGADGYVDTQKWARIREEASKDKALKAWFDANYSPESVLNPDDPTAKRYFKSYKAIDPNSTEAWLETG